MGNENERATTNESRIELSPSLSTSTTEPRRTVIIMTIIGAVVGAVGGAVGFSEWSQPNLGAGVFGMILGAGVFALLTLGMYAILKPLPAAVITVLWCALLGMLFARVWWDLHLETRSQAAVAGLAAGAIIGVIGVNRQRLAWLVKGRPQ
jgi:hypothetical protein